MNHHLNTCATCRDWGHLEKHADHWPPKSVHCDTCDDRGRIAHVVEVSVGVNVDSDGMIPCRDCRGDRRHV